MQNDTHEQLREITQQIHELGRQWAEAQERGDVDALETLLTDDFKLVGPLGFVLDKQQWLAQYRSGALQVGSLEWDEVDVRAYAYWQAAIAIGALTQQAEYQGHPANGRFRVTQIAVRNGDGWKLAGVHYSPIAAPPGSGG
jgi:ketosteroid isomerase-like protein